MPSRLEERGAVAVEFALLFPVQLLMLAGIFGIGVAMVEDMQLNFVVQGAAQIEAGWTSVPSSTGVIWASAQLPSATFSPNSCVFAGTPGAQIIGQWPINLLGLLPGIPTLTLSAQACSPIKPPTQPAPPTG
ncbi:MAG TPA: TadE family protein [Stellaceae bacterium]|nr:TadE family protein [Stellaceae bacterium]